MEPQGKAQDSKPVDIKEMEKLSNLALQIWPPTQRTRDTVVKRLVETLSSTSVLTKRYGKMPVDEASVVAKSTEAEAFSIADASCSPESDRIEVLQFYSKEISERLLDTVKAWRGATVAASPAAPSASAAVDSRGEEVSSASVCADA